MPTVQQLLTDVGVRLQYSTQSFTDATVIGWMNDTQNEIWRWMASTEVFSFQTVAGQATYAAASDMKLDRIITLSVSNSTVSDGTEQYDDYTYAGPDDQLVGNQYFDALGEIGLYPIPSTANGTGYTVKVRYEASPVQLSTSTLSTVPSINMEYQDILKFRVLRDLCFSGRDPDVDLGNNYEEMYQEILDRIKMDYYKRNQAKPRLQRPYNAGWFRGFGTAQTGSTSAST